MNKREFLGRTFAAALASTTLPMGGAKAKRAVAAGKRHNLMIITVDDMDVSLMGYMGNKHGLTPNLDSLAARSHVFEHNRGALRCLQSRQLLHQ